MRQRVKLEHLSLEEQVPSFDICALKEIVTDDQPNLSQLACRHR